VIKFDKELIF